MGKGNVTESARVKARDPQRGIIRYAGIDGRMDVSRDFIARCLYGFLIYRRVKPRLRKPARGARCTPARLPCVADRALSASVDALFAGQVNFLRAVRTGDAERVGVPLVNPDKSSRFDAS